MKVRPKPEEEQASALLLSSTSIDSGDTLSTFNPPTTDTTTTSSSSRIRMMGSERVVSTTYSDGTCTVTPSLLPLLTRSPFLPHSAFPLQFATSHGAKSRGAKEAFVNPVLNKMYRPPTPPRSGGQGRPGGGRTFSGAAAPLSPMFAKLCALCTVSILAMAGLLSRLDTQKPANQMQNYRHTIVRKRRSKSRKLHDYMIENGIEEPIYVAAGAERFLIEHGSGELHFNRTARDEMPEGCRIWNDPEAAPSIYYELHTYLQELQSYNDALQEFSLFETKTKGNPSKRKGRANHAKVSDIRTLLTGDDEEADYNACQLLELSGDTRDIQQAFFGKSGLLSRSLRGGWLEPLLPPMRHPYFCTVGKKGNYLNVDFLVHDFGHICRHSLRPGTRVALFDLGASSKISSASLKLMSRFQQFGIPLDHWYAFEIKPTSVGALYQKYAPRQLEAAHDFNLTYHWVTGGASTEEGHPQNPFTILQQEFKKEDLVLVKMDIDITEIELKYAQQLLDTPELWQLVDLFYFEQHVHMAEMTSSWKNTMSGSLQDTLELFTGLRERGIPAHYWV